MNTAISNLAWPSDSDMEAVALAAKLGFDGIELAPMKVLGPLDGIELSAVAEYRGRLADLGLAVPALQGILHGVPDIHLFRSEAARSRMAAALRRIAQIAQEFGARACVFGAPALRDPGLVPLEAAHALAVDFFGGLAPVFHDAGTALCFEANPPLYHCRFITRTIEAFELVRAVGHPGVKLQLDTGTVFINGEPAEVIDAVASEIGHIHVSEPMLVAIGTAGVDHASIAAALRRVDHRGWASIEMRATTDHIAAMRTARRVLTDTYLAGPAQ